MCIGEFSKVYHVLGRDYNNAGRASTSIKATLKGLGVRPEIIRRLAICAFEAEMNVVMYATQGDMRLAVTPEMVSLRVEDSGPGIADIELAMQEGYSTATPEMREMGFGAGMGLPNIKRNSDVFEVLSHVGRGTSLSIVVNQAQGQAPGQAPEQAPGQAQGSEL